MAVTARNPLTAYDLMDGMRALAAITVVIAHERNIFFIDAPSDITVAWKTFYFVTGFGHQAVLIFFVLSGYWIAKTVVHRSEKKGFGWTDYGIDRLSRLWIVLIPALILGGILDCVGRYGTEAPIYLGRQGTNALTWDVADRLTLGDFAGNVMFVQTLVSNPFGSNGPLWSLANEFWYYVWFPAIYELFVRRRHGFWAGVFLVATMIMFRQLLVPGFVCWLFGSIVFCATQIDCTAARRSRSRTALGMTTLLFFGALSLSRMPQLPVHSNIVDIGVSGCFALLLFAVLKSSGAYPQWLAPLCRYGARSSYSLYVVHFPLVVFLAALFVTPSHRLPPSSGLVLTFVGIGVLVILYGHCVSTVTEAHTSDIRRWLKRKYSHQKRKLEPLDIVPPG